MPRVTVNLNDYVNVKLTEDGISLLRVMHAKYKREYPNVPSFQEPFKLKLEKDGTYRTQLHDLLYTFGTHCTIGSRPFFESNDLVFGMESRPA